MKKRLISLLLVLALVLGSAIALVSCDKGTEEQGTGKPQTSESETESGSESKEDASNSTESNTDEDDSETETDNKTPACEHPYAAKPEGHWKPACDVCGKGEGKVQDHQYEERVEDEGDLLVYALRCTVCKYRAYEQEVPYEINSFYSAGELAFTDTTGSLTGSFAFDAGVGYASYSSEKGGSVTVAVLAGGEIEDPSGNYLVMKVRMAKSQSSFTAQIKSVGANGSVTMVFSGLRTGWNTIIVDITKAVKDGVDRYGNPTKLGYQPDASGEYYLGDFSLVASAGAGESFDVGYVMFCDTLEDAQGFTSADKNVTTYDDVLNKGGSSSQKECVDENGNPIKHEYIINDDGTHTLAKTCFQCGLAAVENEPHIYAQIKLENGDYTYACSACGHSQFGTNINKYIAASQIATNAPTYYKITQITKEGLLTDKEGGFDYASFTGQATTAQILFARDSTVGTDAERAGAFDVGNATYFIIRMRTTHPDVSFGIQFGTEGDGVTNFTFPTAVAPANEWVTYVVNLAEVMPNTYAPDDAGNYRVTQFYYHIGGANFTNQVVYDIHYNAFVSSWEEVDAIVEDETIVYATASKTGAIVKTEDRSCVGGHSGIVDTTGGKCTIKCGNCGYVIKTYDVTGADVFYPAEVLNSFTNTNGKVDITYKTEENGQTYVHLDNMVTNGPSGGNWMGWNVISSGKGVEAGRFMIIKVRIGENGLGQSQLRLYTGTSQGVVSEGQAVSLKVSEDGQWHTIVVDLYTRIGNPSTFMVPEGNGKFMIRALQIRPFSGAQTKAEADDWMDIEYIAFCDELADLAGIIGEEQYEWSVSATESEIRNTSDGGEGGGTLPEVPTDPSLLHNVSVSKSEGADGSVTYTYSCSHCDMSISKTVPVSAAEYYFSAEDTAKSAAVYYALSDNKLSSDGVTAYSRFTGNNATAQTLWLRVQEDCRFDTSTGDKFIGKTLDLGAAEYFVIKARTNKASQNLAIHFSTTAKNGATAVSDGSQSGFDIEGNKLEKGATYATTEGYKAVLIPFAAADDGWATYVINLPEVLGEYYGKDAESGTYILDTFYMHMQPFASSNNIDIEYMAFVETWEDVDSIVEEEQVVKITDTNKGYGIVDTATGACAKHNGVVEIVDGKYISRCAVCKLEFANWGVNADSVSSFVPAETILSGAIVTGEAEMKYLIENGVPFIRITDIKTNGIDQGNWMGLNYTGLDANSAKYMVIKLRIGENGLAQSYLDFFISTKTSGALASGARVSVKVSEDGQWHTIVVDISERVADPTFYAPDAQGNYYMKLFQIRPFTNQQTGVGEGDYMDISYIAFFDDIDQLKGIISEETYEWSADANTNSERKTEDHSCVSHTLKETVNGATHSIICASCGSPVREFTVPQNVNWYSDYSQMGNFTHSLDRYQFDEENGVIYNRYSGNGGNHLNISGGTGAGSADTKSFVAGQYFVMKYRATASSGTLKLKISSDGVVGNDLTVNLGERGYTQLHNDWTVVVIDLSDLEHYRVGELGNFYAMITTNSSYVFDIAYAAVVDSLEEAEGLLEEGESYVDLGKKWSE